MNFFVMIYKICHENNLSFRALVKSYERNEMLRSERPLEICVMNSGYYITGVYSGAQWKTSVNMGSL